MFTDDQFAQMHRFVRASDAWLARRGYQLRVEADMQGWADLMRTAPRIAGVNATFDPRASYLTPQNAFWLRVEAGGVTVACSANRFVVTDDLLDDMRALRLWYDRVPGLEQPPLRLVAGPDMPRIAGRVGHSGGLWVAPEHRGRGLSRILPRLIRILSLRHYDEAWHTTLVTESLLGSGVPTNAYGYSKFTLVVDGHFPVTGHVERLYLGYMDRAEMFDCMGRDLEWLGAEGDQDALDAAVGS